MYVNLLKMLIPISDRGQVTIPAAIRSKLKAKYFEFEFDGNNLILKPMQTKDEFLGELDRRESLYKKEGGHTLEEAVKILGLADEI